MKSRRLRAASGSNTLVGDTSVRRSVPEAPGTVTTVAVRAAHMPLRRENGCTGYTSARIPLRRSRPTRSPASALGRSSASLPACETFVRNIARAGAVPGRRSLCATRTWGQRTKVWQAKMHSIP